MSKMPLEWHNQKLNSMKSYRLNILAQYKHLMGKYQTSLEDLRLKILTLRRQIEAAKKQGKDGFDAERFLKKRGKG